MKASTDEDDDYDPDPDDEDDPMTYDPPYDKDPDSLSVVPAEAGTHPPTPTYAGPDHPPLAPFEEHPPNLTVIPDPEPESHPRRWGRSR